MSIDFKPIHNMTPETQKSWFSFYKSSIQTSFWKRCVSKKFKMDTTIDFVKIPNIQETTTSWKLFRKIIWNRGIITLVVRMIKLDERFKTKMSCLNLRFSRKSNKSRVLSWLTGTKTSVVENKRIISSTYFSRCEPRSLKNIAPEPQSIFFKQNEKIIYWKSYQVQNTGT